MSIVYLTIVSFGYFLFQHNTSLDKLYMVSFLWINHILLWRKVSVIVS